MREIYPVLIGSDEFGMIRWADASDVERKAATPPTMASRHIDDWFRGWFRDDPFSRSALLRICGSVSVHIGADASRISTRLLKDEVERALIRGILIVAPALLTIKGYFTTEGNILGLNTKEIETKLGFRRDRLAHGASVLVLDREPRPGEFLFAGSTLFPACQGLNADELRRTTFMPGAWIGQRLVKVKPDLPDSAPEGYPRAPPPDAAEQWILTQDVPAHEVCRLKAGDRYWG